MNTPPPRPRWKRRFVTASMADCRLVAYVGPEIKHRLRLAAADQGMSLGALVRDILKGYRAPRRRVA